MTHGNKYPPDFIFIDIICICDLLGGCTDTQPEEDAAVRITAADPVRTRAENPNYPIMILAKIPTVFNQKNEALLDNVKKR